MTMDARRASLLVPALLALALGACRGGASVPEPGAILLRVDVTAGAPMPDELLVFVYDDTGILWSNVRVPAEGPLVPQSAQSLGTILIQPGSTTGTLRLEVRGLAAGTTVVDGLLEIAPGARAQGSFELALGTPLPADGDGDGIPDQIDDCPAVADPQQNGCPAAVDAGADANAGSDARAGDDAQAGADARPGDDASADAGVDASDDADAGDPCANGGCGAPQGAKCAANGDCASGFCADGVCCANACTGPCRSCNQPGSDGVCLGYAQGTDPELECASGTTCNGAGACGKPPSSGSKANGDLCSGAGECSSGFCTDGVCCPSACNAPCQSCGTGTCQTVKNTQDVPECSGAMTCNPHGKCVSSGGSG
jgi:hypothetical protein